jgi:glucose uptake protein
VLLPTTHEQALLLLIVSLVCLASWPNFLKLSKWRFELFYFDFAIGAILLAVVAAMTLGTLGSELSFNDRIAVAGLRSQALAIGGGFIFNIGNMLLVAAISLVGMAASVPLAVSIGLLVALAVNWQASSPTLLILGIAALLTAAVTAIIAARNRVAPKTRTAAHVSKNARRATKGIVVACLGGAMIGGSTPLAEGAFWGDLGLGAYAGFLMFCLGIVLSTAIFNLFFMNIGIEGGRVGLGNYLGGTPGQHILGILGGATWAVGSLAVLLEQSVPAVIAPGQTAFTLLTEGSVLLTIVWGIFAWREFAGSAKKAKLSIGLTIAFFACALILLGFRLQP